MAALTLGALGVVYGDIGTSPLYAVKEAFHGRWGLAPSPDNVLGVLSLAFWLLSLVVGVKYLVLLFRAHHHGHGGIAALLTLVLAGKRPGGRTRAAAVGLGLLGAALLYGDGMITPAISVLSAVEGLEVASPDLGFLVLPLTVAILLGLFAVQRLGTGRVGAFFGPVILVWLVVLALLGARGVVQNPEILRAIDPRAAFDLFRDHGAAALGVLSAVVLVVTGGEALYADLGHFGPRPIRLGWFAVAYPALVLNYFGQGALLLGRPEAAANPFYALAPGWAVWPLTGLATAATIIASQALISAAFSLTEQLSRLGFLPRVRIAHTSARMAGQIYVPQTNAALCVACLALVLSFRDASRMAAAYGLAVVGTMAISSLLFYLVARHRWRWGVWRAGAVAGVMLAVEAALLVPNLLKLRQGAWFPVLVALVLLVLMTTWQRGRALVNERLADRTLPESAFLEELERRRPPRVPGTAVFMTSLAQGVPPTLLHHFKHNKVLHQRVVLVTVVALEVPVVAAGDRLEITALGSGLERVVLRHGFMEVPDVPAALRRIEPPERAIDPADTSYFLGRETVVPTGSRGMAAWRKRLFAALARNAGRPAFTFRLPPNRVVELGSEIEI